MLEAESKSHRRYNPLLGEWVLCSPGRLRRPWKGQLEVSGPIPLAAYDPDCYMCPGNARASGERNPDYAGVFVFDNDFPALDERDSSPSPLGRGELLRSEPAFGRCRVVCFSPQHHLSFASLSRESLVAVVDAWAQEWDGLSRSEGIDYIQIFENRGAMMGASNPHPHGQIWAVSYLPTLPGRMLTRFEEYRSRHSRPGRDLLGDYLSEELRRSERVVEAGEHWVVLVPFWAVWPFETMILPRRPVETLSELEPAERLALAGVLQRTSRRYDALFETPFPYSMGWYPRPVQARGSGWRLHAVFLPPLVRSASVRKFLVGFELTAEPQRDSLPETACERLKATATT